MSWLLIIILLFLVVNVFVGFKRGLLKSIVTVGAFLLSLFLASNCYQYVASGINKSSKLSEKISNEVVETLTIDAKEVVDTKVAEMTILEGIDVPESIKKAILDNNNDDMYEELGVTSFFEYLGKLISRIIVNGISYIITFLIIFIILRIVLKGVLEFISEIPVVGGIDKIGGGFLGFFKTIFDVWVFFILLTVVEYTIIGQIIFVEINESIILTHIYNNNFLLDLILDVTKTIL